jgi:hypothetical protein
MATPNRGLAERFGPQRARQVLLALAILSLLIIVAVSSLLVLDGLRHERKLQALGIAALALMAIVLCYRCRSRLSRRRTPTKRPVCGEWAGPECARPERPASTPSSRATITTNPDKASLAPAYVARAHSRRNPVANCGEVHTNSQPDSDFWHGRAARLNLEFCQFRSMS